MGVPEWEFAIGFWCMDPSIAFKDLHESRSIIVMSGTLSPMESFSSELSTKFPIQLEARHITPEDNVNKKNPRPPSLKI